MDPSDDSDDDRDDVHDTISKLKVNSDHLNKSLNGYYRYIVVMGFTCLKAHNRQQSLN